MCKSIISLLIKVLQKNGLKELSELMIKKVFCFIKRSIKKYPFTVFKDSVKKSMIYSEIKLVKISGINYKVPVEIKPKRQKTLALKWLILNSLKKNHFSLVLNLIKEIVDTYNYTSNTVKLCDNMHKIAESNKLYINYRY